MRIIAFVAVLALSTPAFADSFADVVGGVSLPLADDTWTKTVDTSPKVGLRAGAIGEALGGLLAVDFSPESIPNSSGGIGGIASGSVSMFRVRVLAELAAQHRFSMVTLMLRAGAGVDVAHTSYSAMVLGSSGGGSGTNVGYALELGGGVWFDLSNTVQLGVEAALPIGHHDGTDNNINFSWTSYDLDILGGIRFRSRSSR